MKDAVNNAAIKEYIAKHVMESDVEVNGLIAVAKENGIALNKEAANKIIKEVKAHVAEAIRLYNYD